MNELKDIGNITHNIIKERFDLRTARLARPFPSRPLRMLGLLRFDGYAYNSTLFLRVLIMNSSILGRGGWSIFLCPRAEYHLPVFTTEVFFLGKKIVFLADAQQDFASGSHQNTEFYQELTAIRDHYQDLLTKPRNAEGKIAELFSPAACYVTLEPEQADRATRLYMDYLDAYCEMARSSEPVPEAEQQKARRDLETYIDVMIEHDPAMKNAHLCFGKKEGRAWAMNLFFDR